MADWSDALPEPHTVFVDCRCPDVELCHTLDLVKDRDTGWRDAFRFRAEIERLTAEIAALRRDRSP